MGSRAEALAGRRAAADGGLTQATQESPDLRNNRGLTPIILLIHDYRRLLLRDPELPDVLLPVDWPGQKARLLCKELYRRLAPASERYLDQFLTLADGSNPPLDPAYAERFPQDDPLASMAL